MRSPFRRWARSSQILPRTVEEADTNQPGWEFKFNDVAVFFNVNHSQHIKHKSRNIGSYMAMVVNPTHNFDIVAPMINGERKISNLIRERVKSYNNGVIADTLGIFDTGKPDWQQYQHEEGDAVRPDSCPIAIQRR